MQKLDELITKRKSITEFVEAFNTDGRLSRLEINVTEFHVTSQEQLLKKYVNALISNIDSRFSSAVPVLEAFSIFDCMAVTSPSATTEFQQFGVEHLNTLTPY